MGFRSSPTERCLAKIHDERTAAEFQRQASSKEAAASTGFPRYGDHIDSPDGAVYDPRSGQWRRRVTVSLTSEAADRLERLRAQENGNRSRAVSKALLRASEIGVSDAEAADFIKRSEFAGYLRRILATSGDPAAREAALAVLKGLGAA